MPKPNAHAYPYTVTPGEDGFFLLQFLDVQEAHTDGNSREEAEAGALDCLLAAFGAYMHLRRDIPGPSTVKGAAGRIVLPALVAAKLALYQALRDEKVTKVELARRLGCDHKDVRRLLDVDHRSHIGAVANALEQLGRRLVVSVEPLQG